VSGILDAYANTQYRPVSTVETGEDHPLSVRAYADYASAINNYKLLVGAPRRAQICFPHWESEDSETADHVVQVFGPLFVPDGYSVIRYDACTRRSAGGLNITWSVYVTQVPYLGPRKAFDSTVFVGRWDSSTFTTSSNSWKWNNATTSDIDIFADIGQQFVYVTLVATNSDAFSRSKMSYFGVRAELR